MQHSKGTRCRSATSSGVTAGNIVCGKHGVVTSHKQWRQQQHATNRSSGWHPRVHIQLVDVHQHKRPRNGKDDADALRAEHSRLL